MTNRYFNKQLNEFWGLIDENLYGIPIKKRECFRDTIDELGSNHSVMFNQLVTLTTREKIYKDFCRCILMLKSNRLCDDVLERLKQRISIHSNQLVMVKSPNSSKNREFLMTSHNYLAMMNRHLKIKNQREKQ